MPQTQGTGSIAASVYGQQRFFSAEEQVGTQVVYELATLETQCISEAPSPSGIRWAILQPQVGFAPQGLGGQLRAETPKRPVMFRGKSSLPKTSAQSQE